MSRPLRRDDAVEASVVVRAAPAAVRAVVADPLRFPEWSPECVRVTWLDAHRFRGWNRRGLGVWCTTARVVAREPDEFAFVVRLLGRDFTRWSYRTQPHPDGTLLTEEVRMCLDLPVPVRAFEVALMGVRDRRADLQRNLEQCLRRIRDVVEGSQASASTAASSGES
ncbi:SRPBCC family protein [Nocardioides nanhaiensis]|uniref:SRPBCC family protein n=1 Tax=Nocardioides nanhaiensis TaxID=1476871 RepID=UPI0031F138D5